MVRQWGDAVLEISSKYTYPGVTGYGTIANPAFGLTAEELAKYKGIKLSFDVDSKYAKQYQIFVVADASNVWDVAISKNTEYPSAGKSITVDLSVEDWKTAAEKAGILIRTNGPQAGEGFVGTITIKEIKLIAKD